MYMYTHKAHDPSHHWPTPMIAHTPLVAGNLQKIGGFTGGTIALMCIMYMYTKSIEKKVERERPKLTVGEYMQVSAGIAATL